MWDNVGKLNNFGRIKIFCKTIKEGFQSEYL